MIPGLGGLGGIPRMIPESWWKPSGLGGLGKYGYASGMILVLVESHLVLVEFLDLSRWWNDWQEQKDALELG